MVKEHYDHYTTGRVLHVDESQGKAIPTISQENSSQEQDSILRMM